MRGFLNFLNKIFFRGYRLLLFSLSIITIIYFFPIKGKFKYDFEKGRPWQYENLYAPFDFTLKKTQEEINEEFVFDLFLQTSTFGNATKILHT